MKEICMEKAIHIAKQNMEHFEAPFGCCIDVDGQMIVAGNSCHSQKDPTRHAEINAIGKACAALDRTTLENATIYTTSEPCLMCMGAINWAGIPRLVYGLSIHNSLKLGYKEVNLTADAISKHFPYAIKITGGVMEEECRELFVEWEKKRRFLRLFSK